MTSHNLIVSELEPSATNEASARSPEAQVAYSIAVSLKRIADHFEREAPHKPSPLRPTGQKPI